MILNEETLKKFSYNETTIQQFSQKILIVKCDLCGAVFEKEAIKVFMARKNSKSTTDVCNNIKCIKKKRENTMIRKYGVKNDGLSTELRNKVKQTCLQRYGVEEALLNPNIKKNADLACQKKYGVENVFQSDWCKEKSKLTCLKKYGVEYASQSDLIKNKKIQNSIKNYGIIHPNKNITIKNKIKKSHDKIQYDTFLKINSNDFNFNISVEDFLKRKENNIFDFECKKCGNKFSREIVQGYNLGLKSICFRCNPRPRSEVEHQLEIFLLSIYTKEIKKNIRKELNNVYEIDFFLPQLKLGIELNGNYYHSEIEGKKDRQYHINKLNKCNEKNIKLIQIFEDEWLNKQEIVKSRLKHILGVNNNNKIYARKCEIKNIEYQEAAKFLDKYHLQGKSKSSIQLGAYYNNELVSVMSLSKLRKIMGFKKTDNNYYEIVRFASKNNVVGIASKLLSYFIKTYKPTKIISYADRRWSTGNLYEKLGFKKVSDGVPNYWYVSKKNYLDRHHRFQFRKDQLSKKLAIFDSNLTEWQNMQLNGYDRIWDCGSLKYELNLH